MTAGRRQPADGQLQRRAPAGLLRVTLLVLSIDLNMYTALDSTVAGCCM